MYKRNGRTTGNPVSRSSSIQTHFTGKIRKVEEVRGQFHQHFTRSLYMPRSEKHKNDSNNLIEFRCFWDLRAEKLHINMLVKSTPGRPGYTYIFKGMCKTQKSKIANQYSRNGKKLLSNLVTTLPSNKTIYHLLQNNFAFFFRTNFSSKQKKYLKRKFIFNNLHTYLTLSLFFLQCLFQEAKTFPILIDLV